MTNQTLIICTVVLCSLGGWYLLLAKYFELKATVKKQRSNFTSNRVQATKKVLDQDPEADEYYNSDPSTLNSNFEFPSDIDFTHDNHIPGMGPPPLANLPFQIPSEVVESMRKANMQTSSNKERAVPKFDSQESSSVSNTKTGAVEPQSKREICNWASIMHLSGLGFVTGIPFVNIIIPAILWLVRKEQHPYLAKQGREVINFQITFTLIQFLCLGAGAVFIWLCPNVAAGLFAWTKTLRVVFITGMYVPFNIFTALPFFWGCMLVIRGAVAAYHGIAFKYPNSQAFLTETPVNEMHAKQTTPVMQRKEPRTQPETPLPKGMNKISFG